MKKMIILFGKEPALEQILGNHLGDEFSLISLDSNQQSQTFILQYKEWIDGIIFNFSLAGESVWSIARDIIDSNSRAILAVSVKKEELPEIRKIKRIPKRVLLLVEPLDPSQVFAAFRHKLGR